MDNMKYHAVLKTPIGYRVGTVIVVLNDENISGVIEFFGREGTYDGSIDDNGNIEVQGKFPTVSEIVSFVGTGKLSYYAIHLSIQSDDFIYELDGTSRA